MPDWWTDEKTHRLKKKKLFSQLFGRWKYRGDQLAEKFKEKCSFFPSNSFHKLDSFYRYSRVLIDHI